jgi:RimJ/RimL family protein N-acetyltransferase
MLEKQPIHTNKLVLRAFSSADAQDLYEYLSYERVYRFEPGAPIDLNRAQKMADELCASPNFWAVELESQRKLIGQLYFQQIKPLHLQTWELGYILSPAYQRQGYASEAVGALLNYAFSTVNIHRVVAHCNPQNLASWKLLEKLGFQREGLLRQNIFFRLDDAGEPVWTDSYVYALLEKDRLMLRSENTAPEVYPTGFLKMSGYYSDTHPDMENLQIKLLREVPTWRKMEMLVSLNASAQQLARAGLRKRFPTADESEITRRLADLLLGEELAKKVYGEPDYAN